MSGTSPTRPDNPVFRGYVGYLTAARLPKHPGPMHQLLLATIVRRFPHRLLPALSGTELARAGVSRRVSERCLFIQAWSPSARIVIRNLLPQPRGISQREIGKHRSHKSETDTVVDFFGDEGLE